MTAVQVNVIDLGSGEDGADGARYNLPSGQAVIVLNSRLIFDEQARMLTLLLKPGETAVYVTPPIPSQRQGEEAAGTPDRLSGAAARLRVAAAAASVVAVAACGVPPVAG